VSVAAMCRFQMAGPAIRLTEREHRGQCQSRPRGLDPRDDTSNGGYVFLNILTPDQQTLYLRAARVLLESDASVLSPEAALLEAARIECNVAELPEPVPVDEILEQAPSMLDTAAARNAFLLELAGAMVIDGETAVNEEALLKRFAQILTVSDEDLREFVRFAERARDLVNDGQRLLAGETSR
jgi:hypothetical protein